MNTSVRWKLFVATFLACFCIQAQAVDIDAVRKQCATTHALTPDQNTALMKGQFENLAQNAKCYVDCFSKGTNLIENDSLNGDNFAVFYTQLIPTMKADTIKSVVSKCNTSNPGPYDCNKSFEANKCVFLGLIASPK